ncbi:MAG: GNAT family N-acetyltransferase [Epsilonproteobacteria bacterium]|nr:GNAT family N-acetyltransferase [Campylobacterota bacterium]
MTLKNDIFSFRPILEKDIKVLHQKIFSDKDVMRYTFFEKIFSLDETMEFIKAYFSKDHDNPLGLVGVYLNDSGTLIGFAGILEFEYKNAKEYELGFVLGCEFWGKGYATKIGKAQIDFAFKDMGLKRIYALINPKNKASKRVVAKLGMKHTDNITVKNRGKREVYKIARRDYVYHETMAR